MKKKLGFILIAVLALLFVPATVSASSVVVNDEVTVEQYDWSKIWDANQNNAYIDLINGIYNMDTEISVLGDYVNSEQLMNVIQRLSREHGEWEPVKINAISYTEEGYADTVTVKYMGGSMSQEEIRNGMVELADYTAFGKSFIDESMTDLEKALFLHDFIAQRTFYFAYSHPFGAASGVFLNHKGLCNNIRSAYGTLLGAAHVPFGGVDGNGHAWINIYIDGKWYVSDATFDSPTSEQYLKYQVPNHQYFLCGRGSHYETGLTSRYNSITSTGYLVDNVEFENPTVYWNFSDSKGNLAYHVREGQSHGQIYYLTAGPEVGQNVLTTRDSMRTDATVTKHPENLYKNIAWCNGALYGYRDNVIYVIDWDTFEETEIGRVQNDGYYRTDQTGSGTLQQQFDKAVSGVTGLIADNGKLSAQITYTDNTTEEFTVLTYDKITFVPESMSHKVAIDGPSEEPSPLLYDCTRVAYGLFSIELTLKGVTDSFVHTDGYTVPDCAGGFYITSIWDDAFKNLGPERFAGELKLNELIRHLGLYAFQNCTGLTGDLDLSHLTTVEQYSFIGCSGLDGTVTLPERYPVYQYAFSGCSNIKKVDNLSTVSMINQAAFEGCSSLSGKYDLSKVGFIGERAFKDCANVEVEPELGATYIGQRAFENCTKVSGEISIPNCETLGKYPFRNSGVTRLKDTDKLRTINGGLSLDTQIEGIMDLPALINLGSGAFAGPCKLTAIRFSNPDTAVANDLIECFPDNPEDVALFVVKDSAVENVIKEKWTYGENYWYVDDVIASGELDNGITWSIGADGVMLLNTTDAVTESVALADYDETAAPWDAYKKYVETLTVDSGNIVLGSGAICGFINLESAQLLGGSSYEEGAFQNCARLDEERVVVNNDKQIATQKAQQLIDMIAELPDAESMTLHDREAVEAAAAFAGELTEEQKALLDADVKANLDDALGSLTALQSRLTDLIAIEDEVTHVARVEPTCGVEGNIEYWYKEAYNDYFSDEALSTLISKGDTVLEALEHDWSEVEVTTEPKCNDSGVRTITCSRCGATRTEAIDPAGHTPGEAVSENVTEASCLSDGHYDEVVSCTVCGAELSRETKTVPALGHQWKHTVNPAGYLQNGSEFDQCTRCGAQENMTALPGYANYYVKGLKIKKGKGSLTVNWKKQSKANQKKFNGYQIRYATKSDMSGAKYKTAGKSSKSKKIGKLKKKTKYYVQVRTYTKSGGVNYYSKWSAKKSVKTK